jgi:hypothetical protein
MLNLIYENSSAMISEKLGCFVAAGLAGSFALAAPVAAQDDEPIRYTMETGDTLYALAQDYFVSQEAALRVQRLNRIANARRIPVGAVINVPRSLLKWDPVPLQVVFFSGDVTIEQRGQTGTPSQGQTIGRNAIVSTGARSFISLQSEGTTALSLPSNSRVQIRRARRYRLNNALDVDLRVLRGRGEIKAPRLRDQERFRTGTPLAVTAVRGTEFRVAFDEQSALALTEVTEGLVDISSDGTSIAAAAGKGVASNQGGLGAPEDLLTAPEITDRNATQTGEALEFAITALDGAVAYRTQIARDVTFTDIIDEQVSSDLSVSFAEVPDGRYSVRSRAVAQSGLEGFWQGEDASFRRKQVGSSVQAEPAPFADAYKFAWLPTGTGPSYTAFQMWPKDAPETLLFDEVGLDAPGIYISDLEPGVYTWRVATSVIDEGEVIKVWSDPRDLTVSE